jgi:pimeloyl-ACP methyl ester carboxylesterase
MSSRAGNRSCHPHHAVAVYPLDSLQRRVLAIHGIADEAAPFAHAEPLRRRVSNSELLTLEGSGHVALFTHNALIRPRVARVLAGG